MRRGRLQQPFFILFAFMIVMTPIATATDVTLELWHMWTGNREPLLLDAVKRFEAANPGIKVNVTLGHATSVAQGQEKMTVAWAAGAGPDVGMVNGTSAQSYAATGTLLALDPLAAKEGPAISKFIIPSIAQSIKDPVQNGQTYFLPMLIGSEGLLYYNRRLLSEAGYNADGVPKTHSELLSMAQRLTRRGGDGTPTQLGFEILKGTWVGHYTTLELLMNQWGTSLNSMDAKTILPDVPKAIELVGWMKDFAERVGDNPTKGDFVFTTEKLALLQAGDSVWFQYKDKFPDLDMGMALFPSPDGQPIRAALSGSWGWGISSQTKHPLESWKLVKWLSAAIDGGGEFVWQQGRLSAGAEAIRHSRNAKTHPYWNVMIQLVEYAVPTATPSPALIGNTGQQAIGNAITAAVTNTQPITNGFASVKSQLQAVIDEWWAKNKK